MSHFRQLPRGHRGMTENTSDSMFPVDLDAWASVGNRAQRRYARRKLARLPRRTGQAQGPK